MLRVRPLQQIGIGKAADWSAAGSHDRLRCGPLADELAGEVEYPQAPAQCSVCQQIGDDTRFAAALMPQETRRHGCKESSGMEMKCFPAAEIIDARPGGPGPDVIQLPVHNSHVARPGRSQMRGCELYALGLHQLAQVDEVR